jgi:hypothetical protein
MAAIVNILEKPIERIRETCEMMGAADKFDRALPELETYLEGEIAAPSRKVLDGYSRRLCGRGQPPRDVRAVCLRALRPAIALRS